MNIIDLLNEQEKQLIKIKHYNPHQVIFNEGDECDYLGILIEGKLTINTYTYLDKEETITVIYPNMLFGQYLIFSDHPYYLGSVIAANKSIIALINKKNLLSLFNSNKQFLLSYLTIISNESMKVKQQAKLFAHKSIRDRIIYYFETHQKNNIVIINNVTDLANILSIPRPSVSRELSKMIDEGIITKENKRIYLK